MRIIWIAVALVNLSTAALAADRYTEIAVIGERLLVRTANGGSFVPPLDDQQADEDERQVGFDTPRLSPDGTVVGWLSLYPNCCTSYPIPLELVLARNGSIVQRIRGNGQPIWKWRFSKDGTKVAMSQHPPHGGFPAHYELRDARTGALVEQLDVEPPDPDQDDHPVSLPEWAQGVDLWRAD